MPNDNFYSLLFILLLLKLNLDYIRVNIFYKLEKSKKNNEILNIIEKRASGLSYFFSSIICSNNFALILMIFELDFTLSKQSKDFYSSIENLV